MPAITKFSSHLSLRHGQSGGFTIAMSLILLALSLTSAMYTAKTKLFDIRIAASDLRKAQAVNSAEAGIEHAIATLDTNSLYEGTLATAVGNNRFSTVVSRMLVAGDEIGHPSWENDYIARIVSTGFSEDDSGSRVIENKVWVHSVARNRPDSSITVDGNIEVSGSFTIGAAPNGGGLGVPLSIWTTGNAELTGAGSSCGLQEFDDGDCATYPYSEKNDPGDDVFQDSFVSAGGSFPDDIFEHTFGVAKSEFQTIKDSATEVLPNCTSLDASSVGLYWIEGACDLKIVIGSANAPVFIVVEDADLVVNAGAEIYGIIYSFETPTGTGGDVKLNGGGQIFGAFIGDHDLGNVNGNCEIRYDEAVLSAISDGSNSEFMKVEIIPGSWKDF